MSNKSNMTIKLQTFHVKPTSIFYQSEQLPMFLLKHYNWQIYSISSELLLFPFLVLLKATVFISLF